DRTCFVAHPAREIAQPKAQPRAIKILDDGPCDDRFELAHPRILPSPEAEVLPCCMAWTDRLGDLNGETLVYEVLAQRSEPTSLPVGVVSSRFLDEGAKLTSTPRRGISNDMSELMGEPERKQ